MSSIQQLFDDLIQRAKFSDSCCDDPDDRMYHAKDKTWWKRVGNRWVAADAPETSQKEACPRVGYGFLRDSDW